MKEIKRIIRVDNKQRPIDSYRNLQSMIDEKTTDKVKHPKENIGDEQSKGFESNKTKDDKALQSKDQVGEKNPIDKAKIKQGDDKQPLINDFAKTFI